MNTPNNACVLAIESGGSGTRLVLAGGDGDILREGRCTSASPLYRDRDSFSTEFSKTLENLLDSVDRQAVRVIGLAGPADAVAMHTILEAALPGVPRVEHSEGELGLGHYGLEEGIALVAGTGASCHALDARGLRSAIGGYGPQFGDEGSAYWIGREGLKAAFRTEQGRMEATALFDAALDFYNVDSPWRVLDEATPGGHLPAPRIAAFATAVDAMAAAGDKQAARILEEGGHHLGTLILDMAAQTHFSVVPVPLVMTGGVFRSAAILAAIEATLSRVSFVYTSYPVVLEPITGLIRLLQRDITIRKT